MVDLPSDSSTNGESSDMALTQSMIDELVAWAKHHGTVLDPRVDIYYDNVTGLSFGAREDIPLGTPIASSSPFTSLSYLNAIKSLAYPSHSHSTYWDQPAFPPHFMEALEGSRSHVIGHFFLMQQYLIGQGSFWYPYIRTLPQPNSPRGIPTPIGWSKDDLLFLKDTVTTLYSHSL